MVGNFIGKEGAVTQSSPLTHQDRLLWLAEQETECTNDSIPGKVRNGNKYLDCPICGGTGKVVCFPMLREECDHLWENEGTNIPWILEECDCRGRGWLPVDNTDATLAALATLGFFVKFTKRISNIWDTILYQGSSELPWGDGGEGDTLNEAAVSTLYKMSVIEEKLPTQEELPK